MTDKTPRPIWAKRAGSNAEISARALAYCAGRDVVARPMADAELIPYDLWTNRAHCQMLRKKGIIDESQYKAIMEGLKRLEEDWREGVFELDPSLEDVHINIERYVADEMGEDTAGVMHTARSRNDQSATDVRLWLRDQLLGRLAATCELIKTLAKFSRHHAGTISPGWTHAQPAMPTTLGHWAAAHAQALARDARALQGLWDLINLSPLGAAASFGTSWPIDRLLTARLLGFDAPQASSLDCISTRWEAEARLGGALAILMTHLSSLGQDLIFLSTPPRQGLRLSSDHVTGSSIMPQKRNPDFAEVTRARALAVHSLAANLTGVGRGALSGYNRDTQWTKYWIMDLVDEVGEAPEVFTDVIDGLTANKEALRLAATEGFSLAADLADHLARTRSIPFRKAYHVIAETASADEGHDWFRPETINAILQREKITPLFSEEELTLAGDAAHVLALRVSLGGPSPDGVRAQASTLTATARELERWTMGKIRALAKARQGVAG